MKTMSFNVLCGGDGYRDWKKRKEKVLDIIKKYHPDTFGLQESHNRWMNYLCKNLPEYGYVGVGRDNGKREGEFSPVFYLKDKYELVKEGHFWLSNTPDVPGKCWDAACIRVCSYALLKEKATGKMFVHADTHTDHVSELARINGTALITEKLSEFRDIPVIVTGDFNDYPDSECWKNMIKAGFSDSRNIAEDSDDMFTFNNFGQVNNKDYSCIIDYIFVRNCGEVKSYKVITDTYNGRYPSDHYPVIAEFEI